MRIDLNADLGEGCASDAELLGIVSSCNVACGAHAGDAGTIEKTMRVALANGVAVGAHPSYPDREGFGRRSHYAEGDALRSSLASQLRSFLAIAADLGVRVGHVKPHGTLYTDAVDDAALAAIVADSVAELPGTPALVGQPGTELERAAAAHGLAFIAEGFIDRAYGPDGRLVPRSEPSAVHASLDLITAQAVSLAVDGQVRAADGRDIDVRADTLCIHGDTPGAANAARAVRRALEAHGVEIRAVDD